MNVAPSHSFGPRIAIVSHAHPSISKGGAEISAYTLYQGLRELGCDAIFIAACPESARKRAYRETEREFFIFSQTEYFEHFFQLNAQRVDLELVAILESQKTQLVNFHHFTNLGLGALRRTRMISDLRMVFTLHEFLAICHNHGQMVTVGAHRLCERAAPEACVTCFPSRSRYDFIQRKSLFLEALSSFDQLISPSHFLAQRYCDWGIDEAKMFVVDNGLTHLTAGSRVANVSRRREWVFGYFGQINPFKGVDILLDAAELLRKDRVSNTRIRIHGNLVGQSEQFCERLRDARAHGLVEYSGPYDYRAVTKLMSECDYVVVPSRWWENSPVVIQEAFAAGCPVICTGIGGMAEKVKPGVSGLHFRLGDAADLARCMIDAASDESHRRLTKGLPKPFGALEMARRYLEVFSTTTRTPSKDVILENGEVQAVDFV